MNWPDILQYFQLPGSFSQVFMVSHDVMTYESLKADYIVLNEDNVALPGTYNHHVDIIRN
jgi:ABC-type transporter Mla maintaining outer membrane lipid asymmetry ATPase subunit MlaF